MIGIDQIGTVFVPVSDQDRALDFYLDTLGFERRVDAEYSDGKRWIEVAPPASSINLALVSQAEGAPSFVDRTLCAFSTKDIESDFKTLQRKGVDLVDRQVGTMGTSRLGLNTIEVTVQDPMPPQFSFRDPDGNRFLVVQLT